MKEKCRWSEDGSCKNNADWKCLECGYAVCNECSGEGGDMLKGKCMGECFDELPDLVDVSIFEKVVN